MDNFIDLIQSIALILLSISQIVHIKDNRKRDG